LPESMNETRRFGEQNTKNLEKFASETGDIKSLSAHLRSWVYRQKCKFKKHTLDPNKQQLLEAIGVDLSGYKERSSGDFRTKNIDKFWYQNFTKLEQYRKVHGHCKVPYRFANDPSLGEWRVGVQSANTL
jgi:hypothetical protein